MADSKSFADTWSQEATSYTVAERQVDGAEQLCANVFAVAGAVWLMLNANGATRLTLAIYGLGLVAVFASSLAYTFAPPGGSKEMLRRLDHAMIFVMIAGTYSPLAAHRLPYPWNTTMLMTVWTGAALGISLKCMFPRRFEYAGLALCVALGVSGLVTIGLLHAAMSTINFTLLVVGACVYLAGVRVLLLAHLRFHNAACAQHPLTFGRVRANSKQFKACCWNSRTLFMERQRTITPKASGRDTSWTHEALG